MRLILIGPPGSGKGTQAKLLSQQFNLCHLSTGDILRDAMRLGTPAGRRAEPYMTSGRLVPDDLVNDIIAERFQGEHRPERFVTDGYPRTLAQAAAFDRILSMQHLNLSAVVALQVPDDEIVRRLSGRRVCPKCQATFHIVFNPPRVPEICDECGSRLLQRDDDKEETIRRRLQIYHESTAPLIAHYRSTGLLHEVDGTGAIDQVLARITAIMR